MSAEIKGLWAVVKEFSTKWNIIAIEKKKLLGRVWQSIIDIAKWYTPIKTWNLRWSFKSKQSEKQIKVWNSAKYYKFIDEWTKNHFIKQKGKKALRFKKWNSNYFSKWHMVKGIKAFKITDKTVDKVVWTPLRKELKTFLKNISKKR